MNEKIVGIKKTVQKPTASCYSYWPVFVIQYKNQREKNSMTNIPCQLRVLSPFILVI